ncbi:MAG TPA: two-component regulator propeller domain-containing protein [Thermoanaerobaculia bacterium]|nr:two-component regulator propeller domain-containing protein [Thermoanaerobaculia bacterium]
MSRILLTVFLAAVVLVAAVPAGALQPDRAISQYAREAWRLEDGLPNSVVRGVQQTDDGYIWIATYGGLARFNGESFTRFDKHSLPGLRRDTILALARTRDGALWIGTNGGGAGRIRGGRLIPVEGIPSDIIFAFAELPDGTVWIGTTAGMSAWKNGRVIRSIDAREAFGADSVLALLPGRDGTLWIGTRGGGLFALRGETLERAGGEELVVEAIYSLQEDPNGTLWIGTSAGLKTMRGGAISQVGGIPNDQVTTLLRDSDGTLWIGTYSNGLYRTVDGTSFARFTSDEGLLNNSVRTLFEDGERSIWVGTNSGLERFSEGRFVPYGVPEGLSNAYARCVFEDSKGNIWIGTASGLNRLSNGVMTQITTKDGLPNDYVLTIGEGLDGTLWIGTPTGLTRLAGGRFTTFTEEHGLMSRSVRAIFRDRSGTLWIGTDRGLHRIAGGRIEHVTPAPGWETAYVETFAAGADGSMWAGANGIGITRYRDGTFTTWGRREGMPDTYVLALHADADGTVWIGTDSAGLIRMKDGKFTTYAVGTGLWNEKILQILDDGAGRLWFGGGRGISSVERAQLVDVAEGRRRRIESIVYGQADGMRSIQCNGSVYPAALRTRDGRLWFPTVDGVAVTTGRKMDRPFTRPPPVVIEAVAIDGHPAAGERIVVPPGAKRLEFHYAALTYVARRNVEFQFRLEGYDSNWIPAGNQRAAYYTNIRPGTYRFRVIASNGMGIWNRQGASVEVRVEPRFVETVWFPILVLAALLSAVWLFQQRRVYLMKRRAADLVHLVNERTRDILAEKTRTEQALREAELARIEAVKHEELLAKALVEAQAANRAKTVFLANMSHELRTPLNAIIGFAGVLEMNRDNLTERQNRFVHNIISSGEHLLTLINDILDLARVEAGKMPLERQPLSLIEIVESVARVARGLTIPRQMTLCIDAPSDPVMIVADPVKLKQILYNLVSNAVKFSPDHATITIRIARVSAAESPTGEAGVEIAVVDQGIGIAAEHQQVIFEEFRQVHGPDEKRPAGTGLGLALVKKFVEMHGGTVRVRSAPGEGSTFTAFLPEQPKTARTPGEIGAAASR